LLLDLGKEHAWFESSMICWLAVVAVIGFLAFLIWELTDNEPVVSLQVFRHRGFAASMVVIPLAFGAFFAGNVLTPLWLQTNMGYTATWAGYVSGTIGILAIVGAPIAAQLTARIDPRRIIFAGILWLAFTLFMRASATSDMDYWQITTWVFLGGLGLPLFFLPLTQIALASVDPEETAGAAGVMSFIRTLSSAVATSIVNTVWEDGASYNQSELSGTLHGAQAAIDGLVQSGMSHDQAIGVLTNIAYGQAVMLSTNQVFLAAAACFLIAAATIWLAPRPTRAANPAMAH
jgi:DHA2 family multidrug resistance protein